jgi:hypothetical protein
MALVLGGVFFVTLLLGVPVALTMGGAGLAALLVQGTLSPLLAAQRMFSGIDSFPLMAVPFFILAAELMTGGGSPTSSSGSPPRSSATSAAGSATPTCSCRSSSPVSAARPWPTRPARARSSFG